MPRIPNRPPAPTEGPRKLREWRGDRTFAAAAQLLFGSALKWYRVRRFETGEAVPNVDDAIRLRDIADIPIGAWKSGEPSNDADASGAHPSIPPTGTHGGES